MREQPPFRHLRALMAAWMLCLTPAVLAATPETGPLAGTPEDRIVAFGDVHGGFDELRSLLAALGLIDTELNWQGGRTRLVSLGDLLDRGPDSRRVMDLLMRLENQAQAAGGAVHMVPGNHEIMNLTGDLRYVSQAEYAAFAPDEDPQTRRLAREQYLTRARLEVESAVAREADTGVQTADRGPEDPTITFEREFPPGYFGHRAAFAADGRYGSWLLGKPQVLVLDRIAFVHGGLSTAFVGLSIDDYNTAADAELRQLLALGTQLVASDQIAPWQDFLSTPPLSTEAALPAGLLALRESFQFAGDGPSWYRGTAACHPLLEQRRFEAVLAGRGLEKVVMGHTPTFPRELQTRFSGRAVLADTGMYEAYYHGRPAAVVFAGSEARFLSLDTEGDLVERSGRPAVDVRAEGSVALLAALADQLAGAAPPKDGKPVVLTAENRRQLAWYREGNRRQSEQRLAAQALDKLLGLGLTAPVVPADDDGRGVYEVMPAGSFSEAERVASGRYRPNWCSQGSDYDLMYVLDALLGIDVRTGDTLHYDPATWLLFLTGHDAAFPTWRRLPRYLAERPVTLQAQVAERLANLSPNALEDSLGSYLNSRQLAAVLARRDLMLNSWTVAQ